MVFGFTAHAQSAQGAEVVHLRQAGLTGFLNDGSRQRVAGALLHRRRQRQQRVVVNFGRGNNRSHLRLDRKSVV